MSLAAYLFSLSVFYNEVRMSFSPSYLISLFFYACFFSLVLQLAMASTLIAEEESLFLGRLDTLSGSGSKTKQQHHQHQQQSQKPKGEPLLVGGAPHKVDPVAERRKAKVRRRGG